MTTTTTVDIFFFFFNDTATTEIYTLSLHDALPILREITTSKTEAATFELAEGTVIRLAPSSRLQVLAGRRDGPGLERSEEHTSDSSHSQISYAVFCLKKKKH